MVSDISKIVIMQNKHASSGKPQWAYFEKSCCEDIANLCNETALVSLTGGCDSTRADILVNPFDRDSFYIECKMPQAQSGQFTVQDCGNSFALSSKAHHSSDDDITQMIINTMNQRYSALNITTRATKIPISHSDCAKWIMTKYSSMSVEFIATHRTDNALCIIPIEDFGLVFNIAANARYKKSGSQKMQISQIFDTTCEFFKYGYSWRRTGFLNGNYVIYGLKQYDKKVDTGHTDKIYVPACSKDAYIRQYDGYATVRMCSPAPKNPTVIFSIQLIDNLMTDEYVLNGYKKLLHRCINQPC